MYVQDMSESLKIARLTELTRELHESRTPEDTLRIVHSGFADINGSVAVLLLSTRELAAGTCRVVRIQVPDDPHYVRHRQVPSNLVAEECGGVLGAITARRVPQLVQAVDWSREPLFRTTLQGYSSLMAVPIIGDSLPMNWVVLLRLAPKQFTPSDLEEAVERVALVGALMENQMLVSELARAHEQIDRDARQVGQLQRVLLPASLPRIAGMEIAASYEPLGRAGGDLYDFFPLDECADCLVDTRTPPSRWCVFIGDIEGHGLAAAVVMAIVHAVLHAHPTGVDGPANLLMHINRQLCGKQLGGLVTAFLGVYEPALRRLTYARAGHPPPLLRRTSDGSIRTLDAVGTYPLGLEASESYQETTVQLGHGDILLLYTDGITETQGIATGQFGLGRLTQVFHGGANRPAELIEQLRKAVLAHTQDQAADDDQTLVVARVL